MRRVAVTGIDAICGLGVGIDPVWEAIIQGKSGINTFSFDFLDKIPTQFGGEVKNYQLPNEALDEKEAKKYDRFIHFAAHGAYNALKHAGLLENFPYAPEKMGAIMGVGMGGFPLIESNHNSYLEKGARRVSPFFIPSVIPNLATGIISIRHGFRGLNYTISSACASASHAITAACYEIMMGRQDLMVTGGAEAVLCPLPISGFASMKALSRRSEEPQKASRPFDKDRDGFVMGEGAGVLILEDFEKAKARGAKIFAEIVGHGATSDANHITAPHPEGLGAIACMEMALQTAGIKAEAIGYINAHGTSTPLGDIAETKSIKKTFKNHANNLLVSSTKSMTGHLLGAAGGIESVFCIKALYEGILPPTINLDNQDPECDLNYIANKAIKKEVEYALNNSFGFGGTNSSTIFKRVQS